MSFIFSYKGDKLVKLKQSHTNGCEINNALSPDPQNRCLKTCNHCRIGLYPLLYWPAPIGVFFIYTSAFTHRLVPTADGVKADVPTGRHVGSRRSAFTWGPILCSFLKKILLCRHFSLCDLCKFEISTPHFSTSGTGLYVYGGPRHKRAKISFCVTFI